MTVFISHAAADAPAAEALQKFLERRGLFVERETGERGFRPLRSNDVVIALWSKDSVFSPYRLQAEKRALDAWAEDRLILVKLDHHFAPVGLRDLPFIDASFEQQRDLVAWAEAAKMAQAPRTPPSAPPGGLETAAPPGAERPQREPGMAPPQAPRRARGGAFFWLLTTVAILGGATAAAVVAAVWMATRIGAVPGSVADVVGGVNEFAVRYGAPEQSGAWIAGAAIALALLAIVLVITRKPRHAGTAVVEKKAEEAPASAQPAPAPSDAVFVSYARANAPIVLPICEAVKKEGNQLWLDQDGIGAGEGWAGEIVRAIRTVRGVAVMCSQAAFESDHVKREIYLADRYKKRLLPVFIEDARPPEDFEYFFAGVQWLKLHETPEQERGQAMARALAAVGQ
jgi:hypothetical protein